MSRFTFFSLSESGHRASYIDFCENYLNGARVTEFKELFKGSDLLFLMVEECFFRYFFVSIIRALNGRATKGLVFQAAATSMSSGLKYSTKRLMLKVLLKIQLVESISIVPFGPDSEMSKICRRWIHDFQFWDKVFLQERSDPDLVLSAELKFREVIGGRRVITAIGKQDVDKGVLALFHLQEQLFERGVTDTVFIIAGRLRGISDEAVSGFVRNGGILFNTFISDNQIIALYNVSDVIWNVYHSSYDQSSGILGRALQFKRKVLVRSGSVSESLSAYFGASYYSMDYTETGSVDLDAVLEFVSCGDPAYFNVSLLKMLSF